MTLDTAGTQLISVSDTTNGLAFEYQVQKSPGAATHFAITAAPAIGPVMAGAPRQLQVQMLDAWGNAT